MNKLILFGLVCLVLIVGCTLGGEDGGNSNSGEAPEAFEKFELYFAEPPEFNKPVELTLDVIYLYNIPNVTIQIELPDGFELVSGNLQWQGDLIKNNPIQLKAEVNPIKTGDWVIRGWVIFSHGSRPSTHLYVSISEDSITVSKTRPRKRGSIEEIIESMRAKAVRGE